MCAALWWAVPTSAYSHITASVPGLRLQIHCNHDWDKAITENDGMNNLCKPTESGYHILSNSETTFLKLLNDLSIENEILNMFVYLKTTFDIE